MSDLIDRQAALDAIDAWRREYPLDLQEPIDDCWNSIRELPAVQPDHTADIGKKVDVDDCISRQAAIDALDIAIERYDEIAEKYRKKADIERNDYMDMRDNAYEAQQLAQWLNELKYLREKIEQMRWIPVTERLPENDNEVLITVWDAEDDYVEVYKGFYQGHEWWTQWCHGCSKIKDEPCGENIVIAWMPLPKAYLGGDSE